MKDLISEFQARSIPNACSYLTEFCNFALVTAGSLSIEHAKAFYSALPAILTTIFGTPSTRGWLQMETTADQNTAIQHLLRADGPFFQAILYLSTYPEYSYNIAIETLPEDVQRILATGATQHLPRLYTGCVYLEERACTGKKDVRMAATRKSVIFPQPISGEYRIKFNTIQFFLYYIVSVATWNPLTSPPPQQPSPAMQATTNQPVPHRPNLLHHSHIMAPAQMPRAQQPRVQSIAQSPYNDVIEEYLRQFISCVTRGAQQDFVPRIDTFFLDAIVELWIRTPWITMGQKLSVELMHYITLFIKYVVSGDLRRQGQQQGSTDAQYKMVYNTVKEELYLLISRLALNWSMDDGYLQVITIWAIWAAPWRFGVDPRSLETNEYRPLAGGWSHVILDNILYYISLVEIFLQRIATFTYADSTAAAQQTAFNGLHRQPQSVQPMQQPIQQDKKIGTQLQIISRLINVLKAEGLTQYLSLVEQGISAIQSESARKGAMLTHATHSVAIDIISIKYFGNQKDIVREHLKKAYDELLQLGGGTWKTPHIYTNDAGTRTDALTKTLDALHQASVVRRLPLGTHPTAANQMQRAAQQFEALRKISAEFSAVFSLAPSTNEIKASTQGGTPSFFSTLRNPNQGATQTTRKEPVPLAGLSGTGYLSKEELKAVREGRMQCSPRNIPALGPRAEEIVQTHELKFMVSMIVAFDRWINQYYLKWRPANLRGLPERLTIRPLAATINLGYLVLLVAILYMFFHL